MPLALFDLDDTLVDRNAAFLAWAGEFVTAHELDDEALTFLVAADAQHAGPMDDFFATVCLKYRLTTPVSQLWEQYRRRMPELASCRPADLDALRRLRLAGWRIGIVTNAMTDNQLGKIRSTGLDRSVDGWCISDEVGIRKPDPEIFRLAAKRCGGSLDDGGWMIGDNPVLDIAGGHAAGLRTAWLRPERRSCPVSYPDPAPDVTVDSVAEAVDILLTHGPAGRGRRATASGVPPRGLGCTRIGSPGVFGEPPAKRCARQVKRRSTARVDSRVHGRISPPRPIYGRAGGFPSRSRTYQVMKSRSTADRSVPARRAASLNLIHSSSDTRIAHRGVPRPGIPIRVSAHLGVDMSGGVCTPLRVTRCLPARRPRAAVKRLDPGPDREGARL
jgi:HAD superfamily hydrolase (TIGR01549 family)